jgi:hypothetical protein
MGQGSLQTRTMLQSAMQMMVSTDADDSTLATTGAGIPQVLPGTITSLHE